jgi:hypothetical protein
MRASLLRLRSVARAALLLAAAACAPYTAGAPGPSGAHAPAAAAPVFPGEEWERVASPEAAGWSSAGLDSVRAALAALPSTGFQAVVSGRVLRSTATSNSQLPGIGTQECPAFGNYVRSGAVRLTAARGAGHR